MKNSSQYILLNGINYSKTNCSDIGFPAIEHFLQEWWNDDEFISLKTSGSTGEPKTIRVKKEKLINSAEKTISFFGLNKTTTALLNLPAQFIAGRMMLVRAMVSGMNMKIIPVDADPVAHLEENEKTDFAAMIPLQVANALAHPESKRKFENIKTVIIGGGEISAPLLKKIASCKNDCYATYGMTETLSHIALKKLTGLKPEESFRLLSGIRVDVDERNCLVIDAPELCEEKLITNDIVTFTDLHSFKWEGRYDNVINSGGKKISPEQLEEKIADLITDRRFFFAGLPHEQLGQQLILLLEGQPLDAHTEKLLSNHLAEILEKHSRPTRILYHPHFLETDNGKIKRKETLAGIS